MNENELGKALRGASQASDQAAADRVIRRDRRLVRVLTGLVLGSGLLAAGTVLSLYWAVLVWVMPRIQQIAFEPPGSVDPRASWAVIFYFGVRIGWPMAIGGVVLAMLAVVSTVLLNYCSRQATLRLVDRRLEQILTELRRPEP